MLTLNDVKAEMQTVLAIKEKKDVEKKELNRARKRMRELNLFKQYLETNPDEHFIRKEIGRVSNRIELLTPAAAIWMKWDTKKKTEYSKENGITHLKEQLKALKYILKN